MDSATKQRCVIDVSIADDAGCETFVDPSLFRTIFANLIGNACKFSPEHGVVKFNIRRENDVAIFAVSDNGPGIPGTDLANLFQAFKRGSNAGGVPGTGLGLVIVKRCVEILHGEISLETETGKGTTVAVRLPLFREQPEIEK
jgi:signal transduction histidine kinase